VSLFSFEYHMCSASLHQVIFRAVSLCLLLLLHYFLR